MVGRIVGVDPTKEGSGNPGTTNMFRIAGRKAGIATLLLDVCKALVPCLIARFVAGDVGNLDARTFGVITGTAAVFGHCLPPHPKAKGGKGVATYLGMGFGVWPGIVPFALAVWGLGKLTRESFIGAVLVPPFVVAVLIAFRFPLIEQLCGLAAGTLITLRHRPNFEKYLAKRREQKKSS